MSKDSKRLGQLAKEDLESAREAAKKAAEKFRVIGDKEGKKFADDAADSADKGVSHVEKRMR